MDFGWMFIAYISALLIDVTATAFCYFAGPTHRWLYPIVFGFNLIPAAFFTFQTIHILDVMRRNTDQALGLMPLGIGGLPFMICLVISARLFFRSWKGVPRS